MSLPFTFRPELPKPPYNVESDSADAWVVDMTAPNGLYSEGLLFEPDELPSFNAGTGIVASGSIDDTPESDVMELYRHGMCWLAVHAIAAGGTLHG